MQKNRKGRCTAETKKGATEAPDFSPSVTTKPIRAQGEIMPRDGTTNALVPIRTYNAERYYTTLHKTTGAHKGCVMTQEHIINSGRRPVRVRGDKVSFIYVTCTKDVVSMFPDLCLTRDDLEVADAVYALIDTAMSRGVPPRLTTKKIFQARPGSSTDPTKKQLAEIDAIMDKLWNLTVKYEANPAEIEPPKGYKIFTITDRFFAYRLIEGIDQCGHPVKFYDFENRRPIMMEIAHRTGEILRIPVEYVQFSGRMNAGRLMLTRYLAQRAGRIINANVKAGLARGGNHILLESVYSFVAGDNASEDKKKTVRRRTLECFEHWTKCGWIADYDLLDDDGNAIPKDRTNGVRIRCIAVVPVGGVKPRRR